MWVAKFYRELAYEQEKTSKRLLHPVLEIQIDRSYGSGEL
jgi:hypothetical protein